MVMVCVPLSCSLRTLPLHEARAVVTTSHYYYNDNRWYLDIEDEANKGPFIGRGTAIFIVH